MTTAPRAPTSRRPRSTPTLMAALCALILAAPAAAQNLQLRLHEPDGRTPVVGAIVTLLGADGAQAARGLSNEVGVVAFTVPAGAYRAQIDRIGHSRFLSPAFTVTGAALQVVRMPVTPSWTVLPEVVTSAATTCRARGDLGAAAATLWEEARKALTAGVLARGSRSVTFQQVQYRRELTASLAVTWERHDTTRTRALRPFVAQAADRLVADGYVLPDQAGGYTFYAPDEAILLSDGFADTHCFVAHRDPEDHPGLVGLRFEPVPGRIPADVAGTLWLDAATFELRFVDFAFVNLPAEIRTARGSGRVEFSRHPSGIWFVSRWFIRAPVIGRQGFFDLRGVQRFRTVHMGFTEFGGEALPLDPVGSRESWRVVAAGW